MKNLQYVPIYHGAWDMTAEEVQKSQLVKRYTRKKSKRREFWIELRNQFIFGILFLSIMLGLFFMLLFM